VKLFTVSTWCFCNPWYDGSDGNFRVLGGEGRGATVTEAGVGCGTSNECAGVVASTWKQNFVKLWKKQKGIPPYPLKSKWKGSKILINYRNGIQPMKTLSPV
jgi:hypothetical protein